MANILSTAPAFVDIFFNELPSLIFMSTFSFFLAIWYLFNNNDDNHSENKILLQFAKQTNEDNEDKDDDNDNSNYFRIEVIHERDVKKSHWRQVLVFNGALILLFLIFFFLYSFLPLAQPIQPCQTANDSGSLAGHDILAIAYFVFFLILTLLQLGATGIYGLKVSRRALSITSFKNVVCLELFS